MQGRKHSCGFTFVEVLIAVLLVGLAVAALMGANQVFTKANAAGADLSTAEFLMEEIRELTTLLPVVDPNTGLATFGPETGETLAGYDDLDDFDGRTFSPPIDADRQALTEYPSFSQHVTVENVSPSNFEQVVPDGTSDFIRVTVNVYQNAQLITSASWLRARY
ncbi:MAG: prepilin-type N-terminal cleavage/methylation domain-containing protein [Sedimentisphaerales bacterium]|jgi:prepilin-type N-terminal cleavage/methylation domain-containing protein